MFYIAVCDDTKKDIEEVSNLISQYFNNLDTDYEITNFNSGSALLNSKIEFDIVFLDIILNNENGIEIACKINKLFDSIIIFISSSKDFLQEGYKARAYRYLIKPLIKATFFEEMNNIINNLVFEKNFIRCESHPGIKLYLKNIIYIEKEGRKMVFYTLNGNYSSQHTFEFWKEKLSEFFFVVTYKGILVNLKYIYKIGNKDILLINGFKIPVSRNYKKNVEKSFKCFLEIA